MNLDDFNPNKFSVKTDGLLMTLLYQSIQHNAMLQVIIREQAVIMSKLDPSIDVQEQFETYMQDASSAVDELKAVVISDIIE